jgi:histone deacetylase 1/2
VVQQVLRKNKLAHTPEINPYVCDSCQLAKSHQLLYPVSTDVWGPAPDSIGKYSYYVSFIDDYSKFTCLKSVMRCIKFSLIFNNLLSASLIEKSLPCKLIGVMNMKNSMNFFQNVGITHHVSCPHAHQQNGSAERKHRHIVEVGLSLLANASMPLKILG